MADAPPRAVNSADPHHTGMPTLDMHELRYRLRELVNRLEGGHPGRLKVIALSAVSGIALLWVLISLVPMLTPVGQPEPLVTPGWTMANQLSGELAAKAGFEDTAFIVETEEPLRFKVVGGVHFSEDLEALRETLKTVRPEGDFSVDVMVLQPDPEE